MDARAKDAVKKAQQSWGHAWRRLGPDQRHSEVCRQLISVVMAQDAEYMKPLTSARGRHRTKENVLTSHLAAWLR